MEESSSSSAAPEVLMKTLASRGWCLRDVQQVKALMGVQSALRGKPCTVDSVESELVNMDLRSIGGKSLPDSSLIRKSSYLPGPKVLQISSVRDISRSTIADNAGNSNDRRLLRFSLTDGHSEITAVEYSHIPSIADDVVPGTKVRLENKAAVHSGIVCLNPKVISVLGGVVQSLYEEWEMNKKYSAFSRSTLKVSKESETGGPPPFEKLQTGAVSRQASQGRFSQYSGSTLKSAGPTIGAPDGNSASDSTPINRLCNSNSKANYMNANVESASTTVRNEGKPVTSETRPKEVVDSVPVQNQAAAQKLLQRMIQPNREDRYSRGQKYRGKDKEEELPVLTLDEWERKKAGANPSILTLEEWERRKAGANPSISNQLPNVSQDEYLAQQLQQKFDLEDFHVQKGPHDSEAENLKMSMFSFQRDDTGAQDRAGFRGRGRGRARGRGRGRGRFN